MSRKRFSIQTPTLISWKGAYEQDPIRFVCGFFEMMFFEKQPPVTRYREVPAEVDLIDRVFVRRSLHGPLDNSKTISPIFGWFF